MSLVVEPRMARLIAEVPESRGERARGLIGRDRLSRGRGLLLERTRSIHTFGMRFPIQVALLDSHGVILNVRVVRPGRLVLPHPSVRHVLECSPRSDLHPGLVVRVSRSCGTPPATR